MQFGNPAAIFYYTIASSEKKSFPKCFSGHVKGSFANPALNFLPTSETFHSKSDKVKKNDPFLKKKVSSGHVALNFDKLAANFLPKVRKLKRSRFILSLKKNKKFYCTRKMQFRELYFELFDQFRNFSLKVQKNL